MFYKNVKNCLIFLRETFAETNVPMVITVMPAARNASVSMAQPVII